MFSLKEIQRQAFRVEEEVAIFNKTVDNIIKSLKTIERYIKNEECSNLRKEISSHINHYSKLSENFSKNFMDIARIMRTYTTETEKNVEVSGADIRELNRQLDAINDLLKKMNVDNVEVLTSDNDNIDLF